MYKDISRLVAQAIDKDTELLMEQYGHRSYVGLNLVGDSVFTTSIETKMKKLGIRRQTSLDFWEMPFVVDTEMENPPKAPYSEKARNNDIDYVYWSGRDSMSADAAACLQVLTQLSEFKESHIAVCGRGHAVKGLTDALLANDYTVTQCHSKTKDIKKAIHHTDVIIWTIPDWPFFAGSFPPDPRLIIDVSYHVSKDFPPSKVMRIGNVTTSIIINRAIRTYFAVRD